MKVAILGSNSFSGSHLVDSLLACPIYKVLGISRSPEYPALFLPYLYREKVRPTCFEFFQLNINTQLPEVIRLFDEERPEVIVNFAAQGNVEHSWINPIHWLTTNAIGVANLAFALRDRDYLKKYIQISTPEVYGLCRNFKENLNYYNPSTPYAVSKVAGDLFLNALCKKFEFPVCFAMSTNFYGPHQQLYRIIPRTVIYLKMSAKIPLHGGGKVQRDFINIFDVVSGIKRIILNGEAGNTYHFSSGRLLKIRDLVKLICEKMGFNFKECVEISDERSDQDSAFELNSSKARKKLGWEPKVGLSKGIDEVINWVNNNWPEILRYPLHYIHKE